MRKLPGGWVVFCEASKRYLCSYGSGKKGRVLILNLESKNIRRTIILSGEVTQNIRFTSLACLRAHRQELEQLEHWLREAKVFQGDILSRSAARVGQFSICPAQCTTIIIWYFDDKYLVKWSLYHSFEVWVNVGNSLALTKQTEIKFTICSYTNINSDVGYW